MAMFSKCRFSKQNPLHLDPHRDLARQTMHPGEVEDCSGFWNERCCMSKRV